MTWLVLAVALGVLIATIAAVLGRLDVGGMGRPSRNLAHQPLPERRLTQDDLGELRFDVAPRGYRMAEVDAVIDRLRRELAEREGERGAVVREGVHREGKHSEGDDTARPRGTGSRRAGGPDRAE